MTEPNLSSKWPFGKSRTGSRQLSLQDSYTCPICRHGQISGMTLMDTLACNFCRHIFTANLTEQSVQVVDSSQPMTWRWTGRRWQAAYRDDLNLALALWLIAFVLATVPSGMVWLSAYIFPPLPNSNWAWFPLFWVGCTFTAHLLMAGWLLAEYYQLPFYMTGKIWVQTLLTRRS